MRAKLLILTLKKTDDSVGCLIYKTKRMKWMVKLAGRARKSKLMMPLEEAMRESVYGVEAQF